MSSSTPEVLTSATAVGAGAGEVHHETTLAVRNAFVLIASLIGTLGVAVAVRIWMPRFLGPVAFGRLHFAEEFATGAMFFTTLGVETYIKMEVATRPGRASEFFGGLVQVRLLASLFVAASIAGLLLAMHKPAGDYVLVYVFALGQVVFLLNGSLASCLQAVGRVREQAVLNVVAKLLWGAGVVAGLSLGGGVLIVPLAFIAAEVVKTPVLFLAARRHLDLRLRFDWRPMGAVLAFSAPFYLNQLTHELYGRLGVTLLSSLSNDREVGYLGAASQTKTLVLLAMPIISAVLLPMTSRVARQSRQALDELMRATVRLVLGVAAPVAMVLGLEAERIITLLFSDGYRPGAPSLRALALLVPLTCYATLAAVHLLQHGRVWTVTVISVAGLLVQAAVTVPCIQAGARLGDGGAGLGVAASSVLTEAVVLGLMLLGLRRAAFDRPLLIVLAKLAGLFALVAALHLLLRPAGPWRLPLEALSCFALGVASGVFPLADLWTRLRQSRAP